MLINSTRVSFLTSDYQDEEWSLYCPLPQQQNINRFMLNNNNTCSQNCSYFTPNAYRGNTTLHFA